MIYGYIRVSTDKQTVENQRFEINNFVDKEHLIIERWIEETISGTKEIENRKLGKLMKTLKSGDTLICAELSRLGRSLLMIMSILHYCMKHEIQVWTIKDNFRLGKDIQSQVLAFAFGLSAQIERDLISMRTKEALARKRAEGVILGRPVGRKSTKTKLTGNEAQIKSLMDKGVSKSAIARILGVHRLTVASFIENEKEKISEAETNTDAFNNSTKRQLHILMKHKDEVEGLLKRKGCVGAITSLYGVKPHIVTIFKKLIEKEIVEAI
jgi:DNA invertase Pin-like site-specific DNA recombinase